MLTVWLLIVSSESTNIKLIISIENKADTFCRHDSHMLIRDSNLMRCHSFSSDSQYLSGMQSAQRTSCQRAAPSACAPPPVAGFEAAPELLRAAGWPSPPSGPELSSGSAQTPAAGTYRSLHSGTPARLCAGSLWAVGGNGKRSKWKWLRISP